MLAVGNTHTRILDYDLEERISRMLKARPAGFQFDPRFRKKIWDGYVRLVKEHKFPTGLLPFVARNADKVGIQWAGVSIRDDRNPGIRASKSCLKGIKLRGYQKEGVEALLNNQFQGLPFPRGIVEVATAGGKTWMMADLASRVKGRVLVMIHTRDLVIQTSKDLADALHERVGVIGGGRQETDCRVIVATVQTLHRRLDDLLNLMASFEVFISDECHHMTAKTFLTVANTCNAYIRAGFSGTALHTWNPLQMQNLRGATGELLYSVGSRELIRQEHVAPVVVKFFTVDEPKEIHWYKFPGSSRYSALSRDLPYLPKYQDGSDPPILDAPGAYDELIVKNDWRTEKFAQWMKSRPGPTIGLVTRIDHGVRLASMADCILITGKEAASDREAVFNRMRSGELHRVVATTIVDEGVNIPNIWHIALVAGGKAPHRFKQRVGRGMRKDGSDRTLEVLDALDLTHPSLAKQSKERILTAVESGFLVEETKIDGENLKGRQRKASKS